MENQLKTEIETENIYIYTLYSPYIPHYIIVDSIFFSIVPIITTLNQIPKPLTLTSKPSNPDSSPQGVNAEALDIT